MQYKYTGLHVGNKLLGKYTGSGCIYSTFHEGHNATTVFDKK
jgi:hypothetical protein